MAEVELHQCQIDCGLWWKNTLNSIWGEKKCPQCLNPWFLAFVKLTCIHMLVWELASMGHCKWFVWAYDWLISSQCVWGKRNRLDQTTNKYTAWSSKNAAQSQLQKKVPTKYKPRYKQKWINKNKWHHKNLKQWKDDGGLVKSALSPHDFSWGKKHENGCSFD